MIYYIESTHYVFTQKYSIQNMLDYEVNTFLDLRQASYFLREGDATFLHNKSIHNDTFSLHKNSRLS